MKIKSVLTFVRKIIGSFARRVDRPVAEIATACQKQSPGDTGLTSSSSRQLDAQAALQPAPTADDHPFVGDRSRGNSLAMPDQETASQRPLVPTEPRAPSCRWQDLEARCAMPAGYSPVAVPESGNDKRRRPGSGKPVKNSASESKRR